MEGGHSNDDLFHDDDLEEIYVDDNDDEGDGDTCGEDENVHEKGDNTCNGDDDDDEGRRRCSVGSLPSLDVKNLPSSGRRRREENTQDGIANDNKDCMSDDKKHNENEGKKRNNDKYLGVKEDECIQEIECDDSTDSGSLTTTESNNIRKTKTSSNNNSNDGKYNDNINIKADSIKNDNSNDSNTNSNSNTKQQMIDRTSIKDKMVLQTKVSSEATNNNTSNNSEVGADDSSCNVLQNDNKVPIMRNIAKIEQEQQIQSMLFPVSSTLSQEDFALESMDHVDVTSGSDGPSWQNETEDKSHRRMMILEM
jgi:hypothetical protein